MTSGFTAFQGGRCQVLKKLGEGGKGIVFLCQDTVLGRQVTIKVIKEEVLDPEGLLRFQREELERALQVNPSLALGYRPKETTFAPLLPFLRHFAVGLYPGLYHSLLQWGLWAISAR